MKPVEKKSYLYRVMKRIMSRKVLQHLKPRNVSGNLLAGMSDQGYISSSHGDWKRPDEATRKKDLGRKGAGKIMIIAIWRKIGQINKLTITEFIHTIKLYLTWIEAQKIHDDYALAPECLIVSTSTRKGCNKSALQWPLYGIICSIEAPRYGGKVWKSPDFNMTPI